MTLAWWPPASSPLRSRRPSPFLMVATAARRAPPPFGHKTCAAKHWYESSRRARLAPLQKERAAPFDAVWCRCSASCVPVFRRRQTLIRKTVSSSRAKSPSRLPPAEQTLLSRILTSLDADKAEDIVTID